MRLLRPRLLTIGLLALLAAVPVQPTASQPETWPGVRGALYESPSFGWILLVPESPWTIVEATSESGYDSVHLVANAGDNPEKFFISFPDDGRGVEGCVGDLVDSLAETFPDYPLEGWRQPEIEFTSFDPETEAGAYVRVVRSLGEGLDVMAFLRCTKRADAPFIIADALLRTERDLDEDPGLPLLDPLWPGDGHTGRPRTAGGRVEPEEGVVRFLYRDWFDPRSSDAFPFNCNDQESFARPPEAPPPDHGWYACDGTIFNIDVVPTTVDLDDLRLGCLVADEERPINCPAEPIAPSHFEVLEGPAGEGGPVIALEPGEAVDVVLWYALPAGEPPWHILYVEPGRERPVLAGLTFFTQGTGSAPVVRIGR